eukprot:Ihof_evm5s53 gene=Ihof_evmTU5s53
METASRPVNFLVFSQELLFRGGDVGASFGDWGINMEYILLEADCGEAFMVGPTMEQKELPLQIQRPDKVTRGYLARCLSMEVRRQIKWSPTSFAYDTWKSLKKECNMRSDMQLSETFKKGLQKKPKSGEKASDYINRSTELINKPSGTDYEANRNRDADRNIKGNIKTEGQPKENRNRSWVGKPTSRPEALLAQHQESSINDMEDREGPK